MRIVDEQQTITLYGQRDELEVGWAILSSCLLSSRIIYDNLSVNEHYNYFLIYFIYIHLNAMKCHDSGEICQQHSSSNRLLFQFSSRIKLQEHEGHEEV